MEHNSITSIPFQAFSSLNNLAVVNLLGNSISSIGYGAFGDLSHLANIDLSYNNLREIPQDAFIGSDGEITAKEKDRQVVLQFNDNPLVLGDWLCWVHEADGDWVTWLGVGRENFEYTENHC